jgi:decaprenyl-phosphate phosphoribosyltransferase
MLQMTPAAAAPTWRGALQLLRPRQWIKNSFVLAPLLFSGSFMRATALADALFAAMLFCLASSAAYIVNDLCDIERDRRHPVKRHSRPLAAGSVSVVLALAMLAGLLVLLTAGAMRMPQVGLAILAYVLLNLAYSFFLKHQPVVDIFTIALGFVLRVYAGAAALAVPLSSWMAITTLCLALYLAAVKRRQELLGSGDAGRAVLSQYTVRLAERYAEMAGTGALVFYSLYVLTTRPAMAVTIPLVLFGLFRYWFVVESIGDGESPSDALLVDATLLATVAAWAGICAWVLWSN